MRRGDNSLLAHFADDDSVFIVAVQIAAASAGSMLPNHCALPFIQ